MNNVELTIWGRKFNLNVEYDCYEGEEITDVQNKALEKFVTCDTEIEKSLEHVKKYCKNNALGENVGDIDNIFKFVVPTDLYVVRDNKRKVAILCEYKFDIEHGLAIIFENEKYKTVDSPDSVL